MGPLAASRHPQPGLLCPLSPRRVSIPLSVLDPPHQYRIHRRKSFDASDTLALPRVSSRVGLGGVGLRAQVPRRILRPREGQRLGQGHTARLGTRRASTQVCGVQAGPLPSPGTVLVPCSSPTPCFQDKCLPACWRHAHAPH